MQATVAEAGTQPGQDYLASFFSELPTDARFSKTEYIQVPPNTALDRNSQTVTFTLEPREPPGVYLLSDMILKTQVIITKADGSSLPDAKYFVGLVNNGGMSLFQSLQTSINDAVISSNLPYFHYKCYFQNLLSFSDEAKSSNLFTSGWTNDTSVAQDDKSQNTDPSVDNAGFVSRTEWFRQAMAPSPSPYKTSGYTFLSSFKHDLHGVTKPLVPNTKVIFTLQRAPDSFCVARANLLSDKTTKDENNYRVYLSSCILFVKVAQMTMPLYKDFHARFERESIRYYYRKLYLKIETINTNAMAYQTNNLFIDGMQPIKVYFAIVKTEAVNGSYGLNPYCFMRKWPIPKKSQFSSKEDEVQSFDIYKRLNTLEKQQKKSKRKQERKEQKLAFYKMLLKAQTKNKGKGIAGKDLAKNVQRVQPLTETAESVPQTDGQSELDYSPSEDDDESEDSDSGDSEYSLSTPEEDNSEFTVEEDSESFHTAERERQPEAGPSHRQPQAGSTNLMAPSNTSSIRVTGVSEAKREKTEKLFKKFLSSVKKNKSKKMSKVPFDRIKRHEPPSFETPRQKLVGADAEISYVTSFELEIDSHPVDQLKVQATEDECCEAYLRFLSTNGLYNSIHTNSISYEMFCNGGYTIYAFDLTTNAESALDPYSVPTARTGFLRAKITFNKPPLLDLSLIVLGESTELMTIDKDRRVLLSYRNVSKVPS